MTDKDIKNETLKRISEKGIKPIPKYYFVAKNYTLWVLSALLIVLSSISASIVLFLLTSQDWDIYKYLNKNLAEFLLISIPYLWIVLAIFFVMSLFFIFKKTKEGYRFEVRVAAGTGTAVVFVLTSAMLFSGLSCKIHEEISAKTPMYRNLIYDKYQIWDNAQKGLLGGSVVEVKNQENFAIKDFEGKVWQVNLTQTNLPQGFSVKENETVKLIGSPEKNNFFTAISVRQ